MYIREDELVYPSFPLLSSKWGNSIQACSAVVSFYPKRWIDLRFKSKVPVLSNSVPLEVT